MGVWMWWVGRLGCGDDEGRGWGWDGTCGWVVLNIWRRNQGGAGGLGAPGAGGVVAPGVA